MSQGSMRDTQGLRRTKEYEEYFHLGRSVALFKACKTPKRKPDFISNSGSKYWYGKDSLGKWLKRQSNHWTEKRELNCSEIMGDYVVFQCENIASSYWAIKTKNPDSHTLTGKCYLKDIKKL